MSTIVDVRRLKVNAIPMTSSSIEMLSASSFLLDPQAPSVPSINILSPLLPPCVNNNVLMAKVRLLSSGLEYVVKGT